MRQVISPRPENWFTYHTMTCPADATTLCENRNSFDFMHGRHALEAWGSRTTRCVYMQIYIHIHSILHHTFDKDIWQNWFWTRWRQAEDRTKERWGLPRSKKQLLVFSWVQSQGLAFIMGWLNPWIKRTYKWCESGGKWRNIRKIQSTRGNSHSPDIPYFGVLSFFSDWVNTWTEAMRR